jgi:hypothetical protein
MQRWISPTLAFLFTILLSNPVQARLKVLPGEIDLSGRNAFQRLIVVAEKDGKVTADLTATAKFESSNDKVASVDARGTVRPIGDGKATITAIVGSERVTAGVSVRDMKTPSAWSFRNHVIPVLTRASCNSGACHGALAGKGGFKLSLRGFNPQADHFALTRQALGRRVDRQEPAKSLMLLKPTMALDHGGGPRLEVGSPEHKLISEWIAAGAPGPKAEDSRIVRLEVLPSAAVLKPKDSLQLLVRAWYSDHRSEDVTRLAKFASTEDLVAGVSASGKVTVLGHGETAVSVLYSNKVAVARITSPFSNPIEARVFADAARNNFIDGLVLKKLVDLNIPPSPTCTDSEFIRRAYLDAAGILPTPAEVSKFVADKSLDKRARLIDSLLARGEFVDYWAYKWSDLLLITTRSLPQPAVWSFYQFVRQSVADNKSWDRFARDVLTAKGSTLRNGAANYFVLHKDVADLTESTAVTFLGTSITCCRCHNHPLEKWTQDQYWSMANLFSRVGLKNGERSGEVLVQAQPDGEALHPRRGKAMPPTPLDAKPMSLDSSADRRAYFADWLTSSKNPYFARALVNRVWRNFLGRGLVEAEDDLRETNPPTNPELFEALAQDFIKSGYDVKHLIRTIMNSAAYQRSSRPLPGNALDDRFYSHYLVRRLSAEVLLDAFSQVTGVATPFDRTNTTARDSTNPYGGYPLGTRAMQLPDSLVVSRFLDAFGRPERAQTCSCERSQDSSVGQALHVNNGKTLNDKLRAKDSRIAKWVAAKMSNGDIINKLYLLALAREPTSKELASFQKLLSESAGEGEASRREAVEDLFWSVLSSREFLFNR